MTYLRSHYRTIVIALAITAAFALIDQYVLNASSYLCGFLLAGVLIERKKKPIVKEVVSVDQKQKCTCGGKVRRIAARKPGGFEQWRCVSCHKKFEIVGGKLKQVAV